MLKMYVKAKTSLDSKKNRVKEILSGKSGASIMEIVVWMSVVLVIATVLFAFRGAITTFINNIIGKVNGLEFE